MGRHRSILALATATTLLLSACDSDGVAVPISVAPVPALHRLVHGLPAGFVAYDAGDQPTVGLTAGWRFGEHYRATAYGTPGRPDAPVLLIGTSRMLADDGFAALQGTHDPIRLGGAVQGACGTDDTGLTICEADLEGSRIASFSRGLDEAVLRVALGSVAVEGGVPVVDDAAVPTGAELLGTWADAPGPSGEVTTTSFSRYGDPDGRQLTLTVVRDDQLELATLGVDTVPLRRVETGGIEVFSGELEPIGMRVAAWTTGGFGYVLTSIGRDPLDPVPLVTGVRTATDAEWAAAASAAEPVLRPQPAPPSTTRDVTPPNPTLPERTVDVSVVPVVSGETSGVVRVESALPDGTAGSVQWTAWGDARMTCLDGTQCSVETGGDPRRYPILVMQDDRVAAVFVITTDTDPARLEVVRVNGDRYVAGLVPIDGTSGARAAVVAVPVGELVMAVLVDAFGREIDRFG